MATAPLTGPDSAPAGAWWRLLNKYHWYVLILAAFGWLFDTFDQHVFTLSKTDAVNALMSKTPEALRGPYVGYSTAIMIVGWATGGLIFGTIGDKLGRARTMALTVLLYALFTGLSALAKTWTQFAMFRFITGLGIGGEFAAGAALVAEVMPTLARAPALAVLQALSAVGNIAAGYAYLLEPRIGWRGLYWLGAAPALVAVFVQLTLKEPERWVLAKKAAKSAGVSPEEHFGRFSELFTHSRWRRNALVGLGLAFSGVVGAWGIGFYSPELMKFALRGTADLKLNRLISNAFVLQQVGAFVSMIAFSWLAVRVGRRQAFVAAFLTGWTAVLIVFLRFHRPEQIWYMFPLLGFGTLAPFGLYAVYFPELFPTRLRTTGTGFCYNVGRYVSAAGVFLIPSLTPKVNGLFGLSGFRAAAVVVSSCYLIGILATLWAPETKGRPLPEDEPLAPGRDVEPVPLISPSGADNGD